jgi:hypothetical protein
MMRFIRKSFGMALSRAGVVLGGWDSPPSAVSASAGPSEDAGLRRLVGETEVLGGHVVVREECARGRQRFADEAAGVLEAGWLHVT